MTAVAQLRKMNKLRHRKDNLARRVISAFGGAVLLTMVVLIWHLVSQAWGIIKPPAMASSGRYSVPASFELKAIDDIKEGQSAIGQSSACRLARLEANGREMTPVSRFVRPCTHELSVVSYLNQHYIVDVSAQGIVRLSSAADIGAHIETSLASGLPGNQFNHLTFKIDEHIWHNKSEWSLSLGGSWVAVNVNTKDALSRPTHHLYWVNREDPTEQYQFQLTEPLHVLPLPNTRQVLAIYPSQMTLINQHGEVSATIPLSKPVVKAWTLPKNRSIFLQYASGELQRFVLFNNQGVLIYQPSYSLDLFKDENPLQLYAHGSSNGGLILTDQQRLLLFNRVSGEVLYRYSLAEPTYAMSWQGNRLYLAEAGAIRIFNIENLAGITTYRSLFEPQQFEGHADNALIWQTTSATDYQESKMSLVPLLIGSLKASLLALFIAIPVALGAAIYTAYFARSRIRGWLKPSIEMLEAVPSVLIGFIAAIWLAPLAERFLFSFAFFLITVPLILVAAALTQNRVAKWLPARLRYGTEILMTFAGVFLLGYISMQWAPDWLRLMFDFDSVNGIANSTDVPVGKTTIIVAIALGVAISPSIYSLTEDAIHGVPASLKHAAYALGATRLQTLQHVVLRVAMPGIVAAIMLGLGRAFGETMIVLMVTGNTPIASWDLFEGLRALTANLAIELPEADVGSIHYKVLFLTACILFAFTFVINTLAELLRQRLRRNAYYD